MRRAMGRWTRPSRPSGREVSCPRRRGASRDRAPGARGSPGAWPAHPEPPPRGARRSRRAPPLRSGRRTRRPRRGCRRDRGSARRCAPMPLLRRGSPLPDRAARGPGAWRVPRRGCSPRSSGTGRGAAPRGSAARPLRHPSVRRTRSRGPRGSPPGPRREPARASAPHGSLRSARARGGRGRRAFALERAADRGAGPARSSPPHRRSPRAPGACWRTRGRARPCRG